MMKTLYLLLFLISFNLIAFAQESSAEIRGRVISNNEDLIGAPVRIIAASGAVTGTVTDENGNYSIKDLKGGETYTVRVVYVGCEEAIFKNILLKIGEVYTLDVDLKSSSTQLNEVVVTAMGIKKEVRRLGYSVQEVKGDAVNKVRDANPVNALAGKVAGLSIGASTELLGRPQIVLRGSKDLLFVVDGVPINSDTWNISPDDIESYSVLKGPNAAALYGSRGINGAVVITTKKGLKTGNGEGLGKNWLIEFNSTNQMEKGFLTLPESQYEYGRGTGFRYSYGDVLYDNNQRLPEWGPRFEGQLIKQYDSPWDPTTKVRTATPWLARGKDNFENFVQTGITSTNNIAFSHGGANHSIRMSYTHSYQKGIFPNTKLNGDNFSVGGSYDISDKLSVEGNVNVSVQYTPNIPDVNYGPNSYTYMFKVYGSSDYDIRDLEDIYKGPQGVQDLVQYAPEYGRLNSAWYMAKKWLRSHDKTDIYGHLKLLYKVNKDLNVSLRSQLTTWDQLRTEKVPPSINLNDYVPWYYFGWYGDYREDSRKLIENNSDITVNYNKQLGDWSLSALAGGSLRLFKYHSTWGTTKALVIPGLYSFSNSSNPVLNYNFGSRMQVYSGYYSFDLGYKNYFNVNHTGRVDNLSTLPKGSNTFFYPSVSLSSIINEYVNLPDFINMLKARISYAQVKGGLTSSSIGSAFSSITGKSLNSGLLGYGTELQTSYDGPTYANQDVYTIFSYYNGLPSVDFSDVIANPSLEPYSRKSLETGFDIRLFDSRISLDATYFRTVNGPQIYNLNVAPSTGYKYRAINGITTLNQGFEFTLSANILKNEKGLNWNLSGNWSTYKETLKEIYGDETILNLNGHNYKKGDRLDALYGRKLVRDGEGNIVHNGGLIYQAPTGVSQNGFLGHLNPDFSLGIMNTFTYKNFALSFQIDGRFGGKIYDFVYAQAMNGGTAVETTQGAFGEARQKEWTSLRDNGTVTPSYVGEGVKIVSGTPRFENGQIANLDELTFAKNDVATTVQSYITGSNGLYGNTEYFMIDRSFAKLRELSLSYTLPKSAFKGFFHSATISLVGRNLLYFAKRKDMDIDSFPSGFNSSDRTATGSQGSIGLQSATTRRFGFNLNLSF
ncbi:SusC/RagA family TonB-linked outer membrane protein [Dysgonomonas sp. BGC7]|uniref:SusC/RagA family TonB-linked outer membrane protein n=1 Tax=Dysgonomonas sp. BGC7 TaxID=1658008 RepID=UPI0006828463|nr:SusC/RagA family TonB-linked outer membrane protein [Dysgonomonas sp. BGC7]MBD8389358.1 SusC/RagA family TonB-linked outer membrane protein [Dysgonomonas sp. BGC7]